MATREAVTANLVAAALVTLASPVALPVSTTHVTSGGIFGIGLLRKDEANWGKVHEILLACGHAAIRGSLGVDHIHVDSHLAALKAASSEAGTPLGGERPSVTYFKEV